MHGAALAFVFLPLAAVPIAGHQPQAVSLQRATHKEWAVIVAGSSGYMNYRHQADACHAYQIVRAKGIPEEQIILLAVDDVARDYENPFPGKLFNRPDPQGPGVDVYAGCKIDYRGDQVAPETFVQVLLGEGDGKVLRSSADDHVFIFFTDHGATGLIAFPESELHKAQLQRALKQMHAKRMFSRLVFYLEACESGSMFEDMDIPGVYGLSASSPTESSYGTYCEGPMSTVHGRSLGTCLGDLFSISWMEDSDGHDTTRETLEQQFKIVRNRTDLSDVEQWGDTSFVSEPVSDFIGQGRLEAAQERPAPAPALVVDPDRSATSARAVDLQRLARAYAAGNTSEQRLVAASRLQAELMRQQEADLAYGRFVKLVFPDPEDEAKQMLLRQGRSKPDHPECELAVHAAIRRYCASRFDANSGFALQFHQIVVNACAVASGVDLVSAAKAACGVADEQRVMGSVDQSTPELLI